MSRNLQFDGREPNGSWTGATLPVALLLAIGSLPTIVLAQSGDAELAFPVAAELHR